MNDFRCNKCKQLQFKHFIKNKKLIIQIKCYNCNSFSYYEVDIEKMYNDMNIKELNINKNNINERI